MFGRLYLQKIKSLILEVFALIIKEAMISDYSRSAKCAGLLVKNTNKGA